MRINKTTLNYKDWKTKVIVGYVLIIALFCVATSWILFVTVPQALKDVYEEEIVSEVDTVQTALEALPANLSEDDLDGYFKKLVKETPYTFELRSEDSSLIIQSTPANPSSSTENGSEQALIAQGQSQVPSDGGEEQVSKSSAVSLNNVFEGSSSGGLYAQTEVTIGGDRYTLQAEGDSSIIDARLIPIQVFGFGLLLAVLLIASLLSYWSYSAALNSVERTERALTSFMGNSSHEMKTPVASIKLLSESIVIAANRGQTDYVKEFAERIEGESGRLEKLVRDMLSITRTTAPLKAKSLRVENSSNASRCSVGKTLNQALLTQEPIAQKKGLDLVLSLDEGLDDMVVGVSEQDFLTIVNNLVGNAIAYTDKGRVEVKATHTKDSLLLRVSDTGCGIARHDQDRIFERFYRVDSTRMSYAQGSGLGLPLVSSIVANAGGKIKLKSDLGKGSTFTVILPMRNSKSEP